jgi:hypothetical protein
MPDALRTSIKEPAEAAGRKQGRNKGRDAPFPDYALHDGLGYVRGTLRLSLISQSTSFPDLIFPAFVAFGAWRPYPFGQICLGSNAVRRASVIELYLSDAESLP